MMIRGDWHYHDDDPPISWPYFLAAAAVLVGAWMVMMTLLVGLAFWFL
jgi:hypothetical protein